MNWSRWRHHVSFLSRSSELIPLLSADFPLLRLSIGCDCLVHRLQFFHHCQRGRWQMCWQCLSSMLRGLRLHSFLMCVIRMFFFLFAIDLIPFNSSRKFCSFSCLFDLLLSLIPFLIFLRMPFTWAFSFLSIICLFSLEIKNSWCLVTVIYSLCAAVIAVCCCSASPANSCLCVAVVVVVCCRSVASGFPFAAASFLPENLFSSSSYLRSISWICSDGSGSSLSLATCMFAKKNNPDLRCSVLLSFYSMGFENAQQQISGHSPGE